MLEYLPPDIREGLDTARRREQRRRSRLRIQAGGATFPILRMWNGGMALDAGMAPHLRGLVDVYDGSRHLCQALIVASTIENGELIFVFKRATATATRAALDFWQDENAPAGYLPKA